MHSTGRGGAGNILTGAGLNPEVLEVEERRQHAHAEGMSVSPSLTHHRVEHLQLTR